MNESIRVLIADDHLLFLEGLKRILRECEEFKFDVVGIATSGFDIVNLVKTAKPQLVLLDLNMPGMDGIEAMVKINEWNKKIKVIILTMYSENKIVRAALHAGAKGYILKMNGKHELFEGIGAVLSGETFIGEGIEFVDPGIPKKENGKYSDPFTQKNKLTTRELEILKLISQAMSNKEIAKELFISDQTVSVHRKNIMRKLGVSNTAGLVRLACSNSLI